jgi:hypothetical protein
MIYELRNRPEHRLMCAIAHAEYLGTEAGTVIFRDPEDGFIMRLWIFAARSPEDIALAIKAHRNQVKDFPPLLPIEKI